MENSPLLTQVVQSLEQNENSARIKKLAFYITQRFWAKDQAQLDAIGLLELIQALCSSNSDLESLKKSCYKMAQTLNKPEQYLSVASTIIAELEVLYNLPKAETNSDSDLITVPLVIAHQESVSDPDLTCLNISTFTKNKFDLFDLRLKVMVQVNPLKAKILLFSALEHHYDWNQQNFMVLRSTELAELIRNITYACKSFEMLVATLNSAARKLTEPHEYLAIANIVSQALKPVF